MLRKFAFRPSSFRFRDTRLRFQVPSRIPKDSPSESHGVHRLGASRLLVAARVAEPHLAEMRNAFTSSAGPDATFARKTANSLAFSVFCPAGHWLCSAYQIVVLFWAVTKFHARCMYKWLINSSEFGFLFAGDWPSLALVLKHSTSIITARPGPSWRSPSP